MEGRIVIRDPRDGCILRDATDEEIAEYWRRQPDPRVKVGETLWAKAIRLSDTATADHDNGPGAWFGGAGF